MTLKMECTPEVIEIVPDKVETFVTGEPGSRRFLNLFGYRYPS